jgi:diguanylate cyclase (GGDEF)-like protein
MKLWLKGGIVHRRSAPNQTKLGVLQRGKQMSPDSNSKVLVVDDDSAMLRILSVWLEKAGYEVRQAGDGRQALAAIETECPNYLITDWEMPNLNGLELCRKVRDMNLSHYVYILFLTVRSKSSEVIEGLEVGADDFLTKPVRQDGLLARMRAGARIVELEHRLSRMARIDQLTQLMPQRVFYECLEKEWQRAQRTPMPLSCVMLDIDFFKRINDVHGHPTGDEVLKIVSQVLRDSCRASDSPCRYGGEEFCVMLPETDEGAAAVWAERVRRKLAELAIPAGDRELRITASFGIAQKRDDTHTAEELVDRADQALLCAKH